MICPFCGHINEGRRCLKCGNNKDSFIATLIDTKEVTDDKPQKQKEVRKEDYDRDKKGRFRGSKVLQRNRS